MLDIKNETLSDKEKVKSYLGVDCHLDALNQYVCPLVQTLRKG